MQKRKINRPPSYWHQEILLAILTLTRSGKTNWPPTLREIEAEIRRTHRGDGIHWTTIKYHLRRMEEKELVEIAKTANGDNEGRGVHVTEIGLRFAKQRKV